MYYVIETNYVGPNPSQNLDADTIEIATEPARTNSSHEVRLDGWCGTTNDWAVYAHGEFVTIEEARAAIAEKFGDVRDCTPDDSKFDAESVVEVCRRGRYAPMNAAQTVDWCCEGLREDVSADTTDERIAALVDEYEDAANGEGYTLDESALSEYITEHRDELRDEREEG
jgi:hypothetical protein